MATYAPEKVATRQRADSDGLRPFLREAGDGQSYEPLRRSRSKRETSNASPLFYGNGTYRNFEEHERWDADYRQANALQTRRNFNLRTQSEDTRRTSSRKHCRDRGLTPEKPTRFDHRPSSDPQTPRFEELAEDFETLQTNEGVVSEESSDADQYEAPPTLLGQAQDCVRSLAQAADRAIELSGSDELPGVAKRFEEALFRLKIWISEVKLETMPSKVDNELDDEALTLASSVLYRLHARTRSLAVALSASTGSSTPFSFAEPVQKDIDGDASDSDYTNLPSKSLTPAARVEQGLKQVELQIRTLRRLTRTLRIVQKDDFSVAVMQHVAEVTRLFGESEDCEKWREEVQGMPSDAALRTAREISASAA